MQLPKLVPDLSLGPPGDLLANTRPSRAEPQAHRPDVPVLGCVPVDRVFALPATLAQRSVRHGSRHTPSGSLLAPRHACCGDHNKPLTSAPGRIRTRDPLLRRSSTVMVRPARPQVIGYGGVSVSYRESPALTD
jgi:hypothetical protein